MPILFTINNKTFLATNTTVLTTSEYNPNQDTIEFYNKGIIVINETPEYSLNDIPYSLLTLFECEELKVKKELTFIDKLKLNILSVINSSKKVYVFLNTLTYLDDPFKETLFKYLKDNNKIIINYTTNIEETLYFDYIIVIHDNKIIMEGPKKALLKEEKILKKLGFNLPFIVELSIGLKYYGLIDKIYYDNESLVNKLWN